MRLKALNIRCWRAHEAWATSNSLSLPIQFHSKIENHKSLTQQQQQRRRFRRLRRDPAEHNGRPASAGHLRTRS